MDFLTAKTSLYVGGRDSPIHCKFGLALLVGFHDGLIDHRPELALEVARSRGHKLGHKDADKLLGGVSPVSRMVGAPPAESADRPGLAVPAETVRDPESEPETLGAVERAGMVSRHEFHGLGAEEAGAVELTAVEEHEKKTGIILCC